MYVFSRLNERGVCVVLFLKKARYLNQMATPFRFLRTRTSLATIGEMRLAARTDTQWGRKIFHAPAMPCPEGPSSDVLFPPDFRFKDRKRS